MAGKDEVLVQGDSSPHLPQRDVDNKTPDKFHEDAYKIDLSDDKIPGVSENIRRIVDTSKRYLPDILIDDKFMKPHEPTKEETKEAQGKLDKQIDELLPEDRKQNLKGLQDAVTSGDPKALADAFSKIDPKDRAAYVKELNKNLDATHAGVHAQIDKAGNLVVYGDDSNKAVEISADGKATVRTVERQIDGTVILKEGEVLGADAQKVMKELGDSAVNNINNPFGGIIKDIDIRDHDREKPWWKNPRLLDMKLDDRDNNKNEDFLL